MKRSVTFWFRCDALVLAAILPLSAAAQDYVRNIPGPFSPVFQEVIKEPAKCTVQVYLNGDRAALGAIVRSDGYIVTKASEIAKKSGEAWGTIECQLAFEKQEREPR